MKCDRCSKEFKDHDKYYSNRGFVLCEDCYEKNPNVSLDEILDKIIGEEKNTK